MHLRKSFVRVALGNVPDTGITSPFTSTRFEAVESKGMQQQVASAVYAVQEMGLDASGLRMLIQQLTKMVQEQGQPVVPEGTTVGVG